MCCQIPFKFSNTDQARWYVVEFFGLFLKFENKAAENRKGEISGMLCWMKELDVEKEKGSVREKEEGGCRVVMVVEIGCFNPSQPDLNSTPDLKLSHKIKCT